MPHSTPASKTSAETVQDIEKRMRWSATATIVFLGMMVSLLVVAALAVFAPPRTAHGLPDTPDVTRARELLHDQVRVAAHDFRFRSELTGEWDPVAPAPAGQPGHLVDARALLEAAARENPLDARTHTALAHVEVAMHDDRAAERRYRLALELAPHYAEAHLGLGLALAQRALVTSDIHERRRLRLQASAHFAAVEAADALHDCALHNRALVVLALGDTGAADALARQAIALAPGSPWAARLRDVFGWDS